MEKTWIEKAAEIVPSPRQVAWNCMEFYGFVHFGLYTFDREHEFATGPEIFNPVNFDARQWVKAYKAAGMTGLLLTCKHHEGFCLWPSKYTEFSVKNSPWKDGKGDIVKEVSEACREEGLKFGVYLSPWDVHEETYETPAYNDYFCNQLTELLTEYGDIFYVWFDNACGEGLNGRKQVYDFPRYIELIRKYQPNAVIFNDFGPDIRWCGNEAGKPRHSEWAVIPSELCHLSRVQTGPGPMAEEGSLSWIYNTEQELGTMPNILYTKGLTFTPTEINMSIRPGWFWHLEEEPHSLERLFTTYLGSVGSNACMHLNLPPNTDGRIDERDVKRLKEFGALLQEEFGTELDVKVREEESPKTQKVYTISLKQPTDQIRYVSLREDLTKGQRVESFRITAQSGSGNQYPLYQGTVIGNRKICQLQNPFGEQNPLINDMEDRICQIQVQITAARDEVFLKDIKIY